MMHLEKSPDSDPPKPHATSLVTISDMLNDSRYDTKMMQRSLAARGARLVKVASECAATSSCVDPRPDRDTESTMAPCRGTAVPFPLSPRRSASFRKASIHTCRAA